MRIFDSPAPSDLGIESKLGSMGASTLGYDSRCSNANVLNTSSRHRWEQLCRRTEAPGMPINLSSWCHCSTHLSSLVFGSPVWSGLLTPRAMDRNRNRSIYFQFLKKTGPNRYGPVHISFFRLQNRSEPVIVQTGSQPV